MLLALRFFLVLPIVGQIWIEIDLSEFTNQIRQHEGVGIVRVEKNAALLGEIGFIRFLVDRKKQFLLKLEQFLLARVLEERKLGFIDGTALVGIFHQAQKLFVARLAQFHFEHETAAGLHFALLKFLDRFAGQPVAKHVLLPDQLLNERLDRKSTRLNSSHSQISYAV